MRSTVLLAAGSLVALAAAEARAEEAKLEVKPSATLRDVLAERIGKKVTIRTGGDEVEGVVVAVGDRVVHVSRLTGKDFFDAVVSLDRITAVLINVRGR